MAIPGWQGLGAFSEAYEVVKTVKVVGHDNRIYRIEVVEVLDNPAMKFTFDVYRQLEAKVSPAFAADGAPSLHQFAMLVRDDLVPHGDGETAAEALASGFRWLADTVKKRTKL